MGTLRGYHQAKTRPASHSTDYTSALPKRRAVSCENWTAVVPRRWAVSPPHESRLWHRRLRARMMYRSLCFRPTQVPLLGRCRMSGSVGIEPWFRCTGARFTGLKKVQGTITICDVGMHVKRATNVATTVLDYPGPEDSKFLLSASKQGAVQISSWDPCFGTCQALSSAGSNSPGRIWAIWCNRCDCT